jgi:hypothetical protein
MESWRELSVMVAWSAANGEIQSCIRPVPEPPWTEGKSHSIRAPFVAVGPVEMWARREPCPSYPQVASSRKPPLGSNRRPPEALDEDVVHAPAPPVHGDRDIRVLEHAGEVEAGELAALVRVEYLRLAGGPVSGFLHHYQGHDPAINALSNAAGGVARLNAEIEAGHVPRAFDIAPALVEALRVVQRARASRAPLADVVAQQDAFSKISPRAIVIFKAGRLPEQFEN